MCSDDIEVLQLYVARHVGSWIGGGAGLSGRG